MKYLKMFEDYMKYINNGIHHKVYYIDDDFVLKMPLVSSKEDLKKFNEHISIMKKYTEFFPNVKKLDNRRASIEKVDTETAKKEYSQIYYALYDYIPSGIDEDEIINYLLEHPKYLDYLDIEYEVFKKWCDFIIKLRNSDFYKDYIYLDLHKGNFGIDKNNNIKLIDF